MRNVEDAVGAACQLAYEYDNVGIEHVSDMYRTYRDCGKRPPCSGGEFEDLVFAALKLRREGKEYEEAEKALLKKHSKKKK